MKPTNSVSLTEAEATVCGTSSRYCSGRSRREGVCRWTVQAKRLNAIKQKRRKFLAGH